MWGAAIVLVLAVAAAYSNSLRVPFLFDDNGAIVENKTIRSLWPLWPVLRCPPYASVAGRPLLNLSFALNYAWSGLDVWDFHAVNLCVHLLASLALMGVVRRTLLLPDMPDTLRRAATPLAFAVALVWALHPLQTESVTYAVQRAETLLGLFYFLLLYCLIRGATSNWPCGWYVAAVLACVAGVATKEVMATAPLVAMLYDRVFLCRSFRELLRKRWGLYLALAATWILLGALMASSGGRERTAGLGYGMSSWEYALTQFGAIVRYLQLCFWPQRLVFDYGAKLAREPQEIIPAAIVIALLLAATVWALVRYPRIGFLGASFFIILAPTSSVIPLVTQTIAEHRIYVPLAAVVALVTVGAYLLWVKLRARPAARGAVTNVPQGMSGWWVPGALLVTVGLALGWRTYERNKDYQVPIRLWRGNAEYNPKNARALGDWGAALMDANDLPQALERLNQTLALQQDFYVPWMNRGSTYYRLGDLQRALSDYNQAILLNPNHTTPLLYRGRIHERFGRHAEALEDYRRAAEVDPHMAVAWFSHGALSQQVGDFRQAVKDFSRVIELDGNAEAYYRRGECEVRLGLAKQALPDFSKAIAQKPDLGAAYLNRAALYLQLGQPAAARADVQRFESLGGRADPELVKRIEGAEAGRAVP